MYLGYSVTEKPEYVFLTKEKQDSRFARFNPDNNYSNKIVYCISESDLDISIFKEEAKFVKKFKKGSSIILRLNSLRNETRERSLLEGVTKLFDLLTFDIPILIETGYDVKYIGSTIEDLSYILKRITNTNLKVCINTANVFQAGYPIHRPEHLLKYFVSFDMKIGFDRIGLCLLSDSVKAPFSYPLKDLFSDHESINIYALMNSVFNVIGRAIPVYYSEELEILFKTFSVLTYIKKYTRRHEMFNRPIDSLLVLKKLVTSVFYGGDYRIVKTSYGYDFNFKHPFGDSFIQMLNNNSFSFADEDNYKRLKSLTKYDCFKKDDLKSLAANNLFSLDNIRDLTLYKRKSLLTKDQLSFISNQRYIRNIDYATATDIVSVIINETRNTVCGVFYEMVKRNQSGSVPSIETISTFDEKEYNIDSIMHLFAYKTTVYTSKEKMCYILSYNKKFFMLEMNFCHKDNFNMCRRAISFSKEKLKRLKELELAFNS